ncbi:cysteine hydrolase family protein [Acidihalobacter prosperus]
MDWKNAYRSLYYMDSKIPDIVLNPAHTALLSIDIQNTYLERAVRSELNESERHTWDLWTPFHERMHQRVIPNIQLLLELFRENKRDVFHTRIACLTTDGRDRSLSQKRPGFNNLLLPLNEHASQIIPEVAPLDDEIVVTKTTDSALTGSNLRLLLHNMNVQHIVVCGIFTDQCVSSTVRSLADESFDVIVVDDGCAAASDKLHEQELTIINNIYCQVMSTEDVIYELGWS